MGPFREKSEKPTRARPDPAQIPDFFGPSLAPLLDFGPTDRQEIRFGAGWSRFHTIWSHGGPNQSQNHVFDRSLACLCKALSIAYPEAHGLFAGQKPPSAALAADKTSVVSAAKKAATSDIPMKSTSPPKVVPSGAVDGIEMSDAAYLAADTTDVQRLSRKT